MQQVGSKIGSFNSIKREAIKQGLSNVLGLSGAASVIINFNLDTYEENPAAFHNSLYSAFKEPGTEILEKSIIKELYARMGEHFESALTFDFTTQVDFARKLYTAKVVR